jgi:glutamate racemase
LVEKHRLKNGNIPLKNIILGCTHYPFLLDTLNKVLSELRNYKQNGVRIYEQILPEDLVFIDPSVYTAKQVYKLLRKEKLLNSQSGINGLKAYISVPAKGINPDFLDMNGNLTYKHKYGRDLNSEIQSVEIAPFSLSNINPYNLQRIKERLPLSYSLIKNIIE